jgi:hypothetical protein
MRSMRKASAGLVALLAVAVIAATTFRALSDTGLTQGTEIHLPVEAKQIQVGDGGIPVELLCGTASVTTPNRLNEFICTLKNNTGKNIVGANVAYSIVFAQNGKEFKDTRFHTLVTSIDPDFYEKTKSILPGGASVIRPAGAITYEGAVIKGVEVYIDYIEFEDNTSLGPNENGSQYIKDFRDGASKLKKWLAEKYKKESIDAAIRVLQGNQPLPELGFSNIHQEYGAKFYRRRLRKMYETRGRAEVQKHLSK